MPLNQEIVGLIPAGGHAARISPLPCSKELIPVGYRVDETGAPKQKVVSHFLLEKFRKAGIRKAFFVLRKGKWDIPQYYGDGAMLDMDLAYLIMNLPHGHPFTLDQAFPFTTGIRVAFGYPDILFSPEDAFAQLIVKQEETDASVVLGIFPIRGDQKWDIMDFHRNGRVKSISLEDPSQAPRRLGWSVALWTPEFSLFMHEFLLNAVKENKLTARDGREYTMDHIFQAAVDSGMKVESVIFDSGFVRDVGTPAELFAAQSELLQEASVLMKSVKESNR